MVAAYLIAYAACVVAAGIILATGVPAVAALLMVIGWFGGFSFFFLLNQRARILPKR